MSEPLIGRSAVVQIDSEDVGYAQGVTLSIDADLIKEYKIGDDKPAVLEAGNKTITVRIDKMYIDKTYAEKVYNGTSVSIVIRPAGSEAGNEEITVSNVVLTSFEMTVTQDGVIMERVEGEGKSVTFGTISS